MVGLGETPRELARAQTTSRARSTGRLTKTPAFGWNPGDLAMLSYVPRDLPQMSALVVVLHGCTQDAELHAAAGGWLSLADQLGFALLAPQQLASNNPNRCFNWFEPGDSARGGGEAASIHAMIEHMLKIYRLDSERVFISGLSAGGAMTAVMLATYPEVFAGGAIVAGVPYGVAANVQEAFSAMRSGSTLSVKELAGRVTRAAPQAGRLPRVCIWHGDADHTVSCSSADALARQWSGAHGLAPIPDLAEALPRRSRARWLSPEGEVLLEQHIVHGLGHGTPLATRTDNALGFTAPFMLEAGISSSLVTAQFWGLAQEAIDAPLADSTDGAGLDERPSDRAPASALASSVLASTGAHVPPAVQSLIARALDAAGLQTFRHGASGAVSDNRS